MSSSDDFEPAVGGRWELERVLGSGTFGVVYEAVDRKTSERVALKMLRIPEPALLKNFKKEFHSLVDLDHPNLVRLIEFMSDGDMHFFTMELVRGSDIISYLRPGQDFADGPTNAPGDSGTNSSDIAESPQLTRRNCAAPIHSSWLRPVFRQLAEALHALHAAQKVHRDIKPKNILVTAEGRVVLLDFGLVADIAWGSVGASMEGKAVGTFTYMSPEQARGALPSRASDWYSFGVLLYQALTGCVPFEAFQRIYEDQLPATPGNPPRPRTLVPDTSPDLDELCMRLLSFDPKQRPGGNEIVIAFGGTAPELRRTAAPAFFGREQEMTRLSGAFAKAQSGRMTIVQVHGLSGIGKTTLVQHFLEAVAKPAGARIMQTRCFECETVPFKAIDGLMDRFGRELSSMKQSDAERMLPISIGALSHIFPALLGVDVVANIPHLRRTSVDPQQIRRRAGAALTQLLANFSEVRPVVIVVDDLQWGDLDSADLLLELMQSQTPMAVLLILCFRREDPDANPGLKTIRQFMNASRDVEDIAIGNLTDAAAVPLVRQLLQETGQNGGLATAIAHEAAGNPLLIREFVEYVAASKLQFSGTVSFESALRARMERLSGAAKNLLIAIALAAQPISETAAIRAAEVEGEGLVALTLLRSRHFIRTLGGDNDRDRDRLVTFHDRIREGIAGQLTADEKRRWHATIAASLKLLGEGSNETLAHHYREAELWPSAAAYASLAAQQAASSLAFERAVELYGIALELRRKVELHASDSESDAEISNLQLGLAEALANLGRGAEAGEAFILACDNAKPHDRFERRRRAAEQFLHCGHIDRGLEVLESVFSSIGLRLPRPSKVSLARLLLLRSKIRLGRLKWKHTAAEKISPETLLRIDSVSSVATGLALVDIAAGAIVQASHLLLALRAGEPNRIARALAMEGGYVSCGGERAFSKASRILRTSRDLSEKIQNWRALGLSMVMAAGASWNAGRWREAYDRAVEAGEILRERCSGVTWELDTSNIFAVDSLRWMGRWGEMSVKLPSLLEDARRRGDLYAETIIQMHCGSCAAIGAGDADAATQGLGILSRWSSSGFHVEHLVETHNQVEIALYRGNGQAALKIIDSRWTQLRRSLLLNVENFRIQMISLRARALLSAASSAGTSERRELLQRARRDARLIQREKSTFATVVEAILQGCIAALERQTIEASHQFHRAYVAAREADMILHAAAARRCEGLITGGDAGKACVAESDSWMANEKIRNPEALTAIIAPGISTAGKSVC